MDGGTIGRDQGPIRFPASLAQTRFWLLDALEPGGAALNVAVRWTLLGPLPPARAAAAWRQVIARHEILRTVLVPIDGEPVQAVYATVPFQLEHQDLSSLPKTERLAEADRLGEIEAAMPFVLEAGPLLRVRLLTLEPGVSRMLLTLHHTVCDGWSMGVLADEFTAALASVTLPDLPLQYGDYANWQQAWLASPALSIARSYWTHQLKNLPYVRVPPDRVVLARGAGAIRSVLLPRSVTQAMEHSAAELGCTTFAVALAALGRVIQVRAGTDDVAIGTQIANRGDVELESLVGCFINTAILRLHLPTAAPWSQHVKHAASVVADMLHHADFPFEMLIQAMNPERRVGLTPLYSVNFIFQRSFVAPPQRGDITLLDMPSHSAGALYDLNFFMVERPDGWRTSCEYDVGRYNQTTVDAMLSEWAAAMSGNTIAPALSGDAEKRLAAIWCETLGLQTAALDDNFFDLGGHSLLAARLLARIDKAFGRRIPMSDLFAEPTLAGLWHRLQSGQPAPVSSDRPRPITAVVALNPLERWDALDAALKADPACHTALSCLAEASVDQVTKQHPFGKLIVLAGGADGMTALGLAKALQRQGRQVTLMLVNPAAPVRSGLWSKLRRAAGAQQFKGESLVFCRPAIDKDNEIWAAQLGSKTQVLPLPSAQWELLVAHYIVAALD